MNDTTLPERKRGKADAPLYAAPALEKGIDILELLSASQTPLSLKEIAGAMGRSVSEIYRMVAHLVERRYVLNINDKYVVSTKLFELAHINPPTHRLLSEAAPIMHRLSNDLDQSCHLTVYNGGRQIVIAKVDAPSGMGFSVRVGSELDVLISASGRVLIAFQDDQTRQLRIEESVARRPLQADPNIGARLDIIRGRGFESMPSVQVRGLYAVACPILDTQNRAFAALSVPYAERIDDERRPSIAVVETLLSEAAALWSSRIGYSGKS